MELELIEKYLNNEMDGEERQKFEERIARQPLLKDDVQTVAYIIRAIREKGIEADNDRLDAIRRQTGRDRKRYVASVAAMLAVLLAVAASISVPVYRHVVKPLIEQREQSSSAPRQNNVQSADTLDITNDSDTTEVQDKPTDEDQKEENNNLPTLNDNNNEDTQPTENRQDENLEPVQEQEKPVKEEEAQNAKVPKPTIATGTDKHGTRYRITSVIAKGETIVVTMQLRNDDDQYMIKLSGVEIIDSRNNPTRASIIKHSQGSGSHFIINEGETTTVELYFYNIKGKPSYLQMLKFQEADSHSDMKFRNLEIK